MRPTIHISGGAGQTNITAHIEFDDFEKSMEFTKLVIDYIRREKARGSVAGADISSQDEPAPLPDERDHQARAVLTSAQPNPTIVPQ